ncbi:ABC transporter ATP-binding protein [Alkaliphilus pronyensis]|uniref:ABC transporter ATP-binding protein n=1 Tax=Alkaliphilus pronyensis TaxID=1482732 RepID=A0A6I0F0Z5_9FIRM|nr:ABC transporter ATP-binding protein [Alkaliphilus pronyensis]KAB3535577.1 ABC transporter ATP-binding protein [Alkaliphilus pronyensis]
MILRVDNVSKYYGQKNTIKALDHISFNVVKGEFLAIMGPSGSGKSTLLNAISTIDQVSSGSIFVDDIDLTKISGKKITDFRRKKLGFIFQDLNLLDTLTLYENIELALTINRSDISTIDIRIKEISKVLGIDDILHKYPYEVSGGQKQRCACARAIINNPDIILADEPTGALDSASARKFLESLDHINELFNSTIIIVTHDAYVASHCNRVLFIKDGKLFNEIHKCNDNQSRFYKNILDIVVNYDENEERKIDDLC